MLASHPLKEGQLSPIMTITLHAPPTGPEATPPSEQPRVNNNTVQTTKVQQVMSPSKVSQFTPVSIQSPNVRLAPATPNVNSSLRVAINSSPSRVTPISIASPPVQKLPTVVAIKPNLAPVKVVSTANVVTTRQLTPNNLVLNNSNDLDADASERLPQIRVLNNSTTGNDSPDPADDAYSYADKHQSIHDNDKLYPGYHSVSDSSRGHKRRRNDSNDPSVSII